MNYKVGDKVRIKPLNWYKTNADKDGFIILKGDSCSCIFAKEMSEYCGMAATITKVYSEEVFVLDVDNGRYAWNKEMFEDESEAITETILCAAIHYDNGIKYVHQEKYGVETGFVLAGYRHHNIIPILPQNVEMEPQEALNVKWGKETKHICTQGFLTSTGKFVDRVEAAKIALESGQVKKLQYFENMLYSEDLY